MGSPGGLQVDGREVTASGDPAAGERGSDAVSVGQFGQANDIDEPADGATREGEAREFETGNGREQFVVTLGGGLAEI
jgi:hypothetical protein